MQPYRYLLPYAGLMSCHIEALAENVVVLPDEASVGDSVIGAIRDIVSALVLVLELLRQSREYPQFPENVPPLEGEPFLLRIALRRQNGIGHNDIQYMTRAGLPNTVTPAGTFLTTTEPIPMVAPSPISTAFAIVALG